MKKKLKKEKNKNINSKWIVTSFPVLLAQIKSRNNLQKLKKKSDKYSFASAQGNHQKNLQQINEFFITIGVHIVDNKLVITTERNNNL